MADEELVLTEREEAIAQGKDPDEVLELPEDDGGGGGDTEQVTQEAAGEEVAQTEQPEGGTEAASSVWQDEVRGIASTYGLSDEELNEFGGADEFRRFAKIVDRRMVARQQVPPQTPPEQTPPPSGTQDEIADLDIEKFDKAGWDDTSKELVGVVKKLSERVKQMAPELDQLRSMRAEQAQAARANDAYAFHAAVDELDEKRYGRVVKDGKLGTINEALDDNRRKLHESMAEIAAGIVTRAQAIGREPKLPPYSALVREAELRAFGGDIAKQAKAEVVEKIAAQSKTRRPASGVARRRVGAAPVKGAPKTSQELAQDPEILEAWRELAGD